MRYSWLLPLMLVTACKKYDEPKQLDQSCKTDKDCDQSLVCREGLRATAVCVKPCGANKFGIDQSGTSVPSPDTSCPTGWECAGILEERLVDKQTNADRGSAFDGLADQPICVPKGWKPTAR